MKITRMKKFPLGVVVISVIMFFMAVATVFFWIARLVGKAFSPAVPIDPAIHDSFAAPDIVLSVFLLIGSYGLLKLKKFGFVASLIAMGMWIFDVLLVLSITRLTYINITGPSLFFAFFVIVYLWIKKELFD